MPSLKPIFVLIHSPLVGSLTWQLAADELRQRGYKAVTPSLTAATSGGPPYWPAYAEAVRVSLSAQTVGSPVVLVGHSGGGALLPLAGQSVEHHVVSYIFVDAVIPRDGQSPFDLNPDMERVGQLRASAREGMLPRWNEWFPEAAMLEILPDEALRKAFVSELRPTPLAVYEEPVAVVAGWPDTSCAYLQFSAAYDSEAEQARARGWAVQRLAGGHLHMLVDPEAVAGAMLDLSEAVGRSLAGD